MAKYFVISLIVAVVFAQLCDSKPAYQVLQNKPGYVAVYIVNGDESLANVNPILAEAFGETHPISARNIKDDSESSFAQLPGLPGIPADVPNPADAAKSLPAGVPGTDMIPAGLPMLPTAKN